MRPRWRRGPTCSTHAHLLLPSPPWPSGEGGWGRPGQQAAAPEISFRARSGRQELRRPLPSLPRPARGGSRALSALTSADPATHVHLPSPPWPVRGEDTSERNHTCRKTKTTDLLEGAVALFTPSSSGHRSSKRQGETLDSRSRRPDLEIQHLRAKSPLPASHRKS
jgi:hypothetical protein